MPKIMPSSSMRNKYSELSEFCRENPEPVFITRNGEGDLAVMSINHYEELSGRLDLYNKLLVGLKDITDGKTKTVAETFSMLERK